MLLEHLVATGRADDAAVLAPTWGHGIVGLVRSAADHWLTSHSTATPDLTVDDVTHAVVELIRPALDGSVLGPAPTPHAAPPTPSTTGARR